MANFFIVIKVAKDTAYCFFPLTKGLLLVKTIRGGGSRMSSFPAPDSGIITHFLGQYPDLGDASIEATYIAKNHMTCRLHCSQPQPAHYLMVAAVPGARERLTFSASLVQHLIREGVPVTPVIHTVSGDSLALYQDNPALLFRIPEGHSPSHQNIDTCQQIGSFLGGMHARSRLFTDTYNNPRSLLWLSFASKELTGHLSIGEQSLLQEQLSRFKRTIDANPDLPSGPLIGSLFPDQLIFSDGQLTAVTGFYFSCTDWFLLDVAQAVNEWCCDPHGELDKHLCHALLNAYAEKRPFNQTEGQYWQDILCFSATRFWVSRLLSKYTAVGHVSLRDPEEYLQKLERRLMSYCPLPQ